MQNISIRQLALKLKGRFAGSSLVFGFRSAWRFAGVKPGFWFLLGVKRRITCGAPGTLEQGDTLGVARTAAALREPPFPRERLCHRSGFGTT
jgi:hypothetical protein